MFNVSLKINNDQLIEVQSVMEKFFIEFKEFTVHTHDKKAPVFWSNFDHFRMKAALKIMAKSMENPSKKYSFSINVNSWNGFELFWFFIELENIEVSPYLSAIVYDLKEQVQKQVSLKAAFMPKKSNLLN